MKLGFLFINTKLCDTRKIIHVTREFHVKYQAKNDILAWISLVFLLEMPSSGDEFSYRSDCHQSPVGLERLNIKFYFRFHFNYSEVNVSL